jgi:hypothetical protein
MNPKLLLHIFLLIIFFAGCSDDVIQIPQGGSQVYPFELWTLQLRSDITTESEVTFDQLGFITCDSIAISYNGFVKDFYCIGIMRSDSSASIDIAPLDSTVRSKLKLEARQDGTTLSGEILYCDDYDNCNFTEIGHIIGFYTNKFEGFYYSPAFYGEFYVIPRSADRK